MKNIFKKEFTQGPFRKKKKKKEFTLKNLCPVCAFNFCAFELVNGHFFKK